VTLRAASLVALAVGVAATARAEPPARVLLDTSVGPLVVTLDAATAPRSAAQFRRLVEAHVYDGVPFARVVKGFAAQLAVLDDRVPPLEAARRALATPLPLESAPGVRHRRGSLSVTHPAGRPDAGDASFAILFADAPALDGRYTVFAEVTDGTATLAALEGVLTGADDVPIDRVEIRAARLLAPGEAVTPAAPTSRVHRLLVLLAADAFAIGALLLIVARRRSSRRLASLGLLAVFIAFLPAFALALPYARASNWVAVALFAASFGFFVLMNRFERPR
jgi:peptidylprolyl isomerase